MPDTTADDNDQIVHDMLRTVENKLVKSMLLILWRRSFARKCIESFLKKCIVSTHEKQPISRNKIIFMYEGHEKSKK